MKAINIEWDIDPETDISALDLPSEIELPRDMTVDEASDYITDLAGFCHNGFCLFD